MGYNPNIMRKPKTPPDMKYTDIPTKIVYKTRTVKERFEVLVP
jgi:hypothetical protein